MKGFRCCRFVSIYVLTAVLPTVISRSLASVLILTMSLSSFVAHASESSSDYPQVVIPTTMAQTGGAGLLRTPHAQTLGFGQISLNYHNEANVDKTTPYGRGAHNTFLMGVGVLPHIEFVVQNTHKEINGEAWKTGSDLSYSAKLDAGWLIPKDWFQLAFGLSDFGGQANHHESAYVVTSKQFSSVRFSLGYGHNPEASTHQMGEDYLSGAFGGIEFQALSWLQLVADYDGTGANAGLKLFTPDSWLPYGVKANLTYQAFSDSATFNRDNQWLGLGLSLPLSGPNAAPRYHRPQDAGEKVDQRALTLTLQEAERQTHEAALTTTSRPKAVNKSDNVKAQESAERPLSVLSRKLSQYGFENVSVGIYEEQLMVRAENNLFNLNEIDAIGVILGFISEQIAQPSFSLTLLNNNLPVVNISGSNENLRRLFHDNSLHKDATLPKLMVSTRNLNRGADQTQWLERDENSHLYKPKVIFSPSLYSTIGSEYGVFDYSLALSTNVQVPVWKGGLVDVRHMLPLSHSDDYADGERFGQDRHTSTVDRILLHQGIALPAGMLAQVSVGQIASHYQGGTSEWRWQSTQGTHKLGLEASYYRDKRDDNADVVKPMLAHYRYYIDQYDWALEANAGQYWAGDKGFTVTSKHWFGDTSVNLYYQKTDKSFAGLSLSIPLSFRKDMSPAPLQIRGIEQWTYGYRTMVNNPSNDLNGSLAATSGLQNSIDRNYYNRDRLSASYINANLLRLKDAYMKYGEH